MVARMMLTHTMSIHAFTAIRPGPITFLQDRLIDGCRGLCIDASRVHDFHGSAANPSQSGTLRHPVYARAHSRASLGLACAQATTLSSQVFGKGNLRSRAGRPSLSLSFCFVFLYV